MKKIFLVFLVLILLPLGVFLFSYIENPYLSSNPYFQSIVLWRKYLANKWLPISSFSVVNYLRYNLVSYQDSEVDKEVKVFSATFDHTDEQRGLIWLLGDNYQPYGVFLSKQDVAFIDVRRNVPTDEYVSYAILMSDWLKKGERIKVFWYDDRTVASIAKESFSKDNVLNSIENPVYRIERYHD